MSQFGQRYCILFIFATCFVVICGCSPSADLHVNNQIPFRRIGKIPVIEGKINGKKAYFIIDTGASISLLNETVAQRFGFSRMHSTSDQHIVGFSGRTEIYPAVNCIVELGIVRIRNVAFKTRCLDDLTAIIREHEAIEIAGILGADLFTRYSIKIDFRNNTISF